MTIKERKLDHIVICKNYDVEKGKTGFKDVKLVHNAIPEIDKSEVKTKTQFLGQKFDFPFLIPAITGGHPELKKVNRRLAKAANQLNIGIGVGSQRAAIENDDLSDSLEVVAEEAEDAMKIANIGAPQIAKDYDLSKIEQAIKMIDADVLAVHLNFLQESIQLEGDTEAKGFLNGLKEITESLKLPVLIKETGAGISREVANKLKDAGVQAIDISGRGGTNWATVEKIRARNDGNSLKEKLGDEFTNWGIPTVASLIEADIGLQLLSTGGVRSGLDIAKSIALGADIAGAALPLVEPALNDYDKLIETLKAYKEGLKVAMFLTGSKNVDELKKKKPVITGYTKEWLESRSYKER
ncbi:MAG: Type II isopentenyl diphosphate isomerase Idi [Candidatus Methanohalarchaeum thermophilum]|uniref:Isopentenyl-diphosphate delta-isomerase n=1 Tax=Methanohalarchaeum thermophilum TaxID=1903181 RepID=A0A1Q6DS07_METT1|nr:MAG: Type II isopentenyl diphosphate isomerase Idi [Candidatus Methanohalarchaeum thermophilum]